MWTCEHYEEDLQIIKGSDFSNLNVLKYQPPSDAYLNYRYIYIKYLYFSKINDLNSVKQLTASELPKILTFLQDYKYDECLNNAHDEPPFDLLILILVSIEVSNNSFFIKLLQHYINIMSEIDKLSDSDTVYLCDQVRREDFMISKEKAKCIVQKRIDYIIEIVLSIFYNSKNHDFIISFFQDFKLYELAKSEQTLSFIGRIAATLRYDDTEDLFFSKVNNEELKMENESIKCYFESNFHEAEKCLKPNSEEANVCMYFQGQNFYEYLKNNKIE